MKVPIVVGMPEERAEAAAPTLPLAGVKLPPTEADPSSIVKIVTSSNFYSSSAA